MADSPRKDDELADDVTVPSAPESFRKSRPEIVGPETPSAPFPIFLEGPVQKGFGRGSKDLGCPTANLPEDILETIRSATSTGIYFGYAQVLSTDDSQPLCDEDTKVYPMAMSLGKNPFYHNKRMSAEVHIMHKYKSDFYGYHMKVVILGYIRPELNYTTRDALIDDIETDKKVAICSLERLPYSKFASNDFFKSEL